MGRPPCCDKVGVKKGPWTPEEDIILVSYIQQHGPGNWRAVPTNTGLHRCSKSCRLRWTNYLRPGIKRGNFTDHEEKTIIHLQALLGNRWAAIASYLPERTDNDIKNYWNTHLNKKLKKLQAKTDEQKSLHGFKDHESSLLSSSSPLAQNIPRGQWERRLQTDIHMAKQALCDALSIDKNPTLDSSFESLKPSFEKNPTTTATTTTYASSTDNIARLLQNWTKKPPKTPEPKLKTPSYPMKNKTMTMMMMINDSSSSNEEMRTPSDDHEQDYQDTTNGIDLSQAYESLFGFESFESSNNNSEFSQSNLSGDQASIFQDESKPELNDQVVPFSLMLENWLFDEKDQELNLNDHMSLDDNADHLF